MTIKAIETTYKGYRFRSRTEARWAVFFDRARIRYEYEPEGFVLDGVPYLPDFWLPDARCWFEVKGTDPSETEYALCYALAIETNCKALIACGSPNEDEFNILVCPGVRDEDVSIEYLGKFRIEDDRKNDGEFWLVGEYGSAYKLLSLPGSRDHDKFPSLGDLGLSAYKAAKSARFEHGESGFR